MKFTFFFLGLEGPREGEVLPAGAAREALAARVRGSWRPSEDTELASSLEVRERLLASPSMIPRGVHYCSHTVQAKRENEMHFFGFWCVPASSSTCFFSAHAQFVLWECSCADVPKFNNGWSRSSIAKVMNWSFLED